MEDVSLVQLVFCPVDVVVWLSRGSACRLSCSVPNSLYMPLISVAMELLLMVQPPAPQGFPEMMGPILPTPLQSKKLLG